ncbi:methyltransferase [Vibrio sp. SS-MA-C1-2]|uniref:tRNA1(Val) (adenine(37)-N6)-methyltransferase n=1 Tax=Vibrio sp. SS-MA-C1-2 TaxID=2908646 RepID=UPI001F259352|nr:methyltransferase [Vibrio sp. SS-MA-C1-2]UJF19667.1 methyltransferase [Vibrio sp. SS-MA-C1-2]
MTRCFKFKQFSIDDKGCGMPVSTDGVLLGSWAAIPTKGMLLDIGTGSGLLSLMAAQRESDIKITAIDIDDAAIKATQYNISNTSWSDRITAIQQDITLWAKQQPKASFDGIICNPPYFVAGESAQLENRAIARHTLTLTFSALIEVTAYLLKDRAEASFILPTLEAKLFIEQLSQHHLYCCRQLAIQTTEKKAVSRLLFTVTNQQCDNQKPFTLTIQKSGQYSDEFKALTRDFYLKF